MQSMASGSNQHRKFCHSSCIQSICIVEQRTLWLVPALLCKPSLGRSNRQMHPNSSRSPSGSDNKVIDRPNRLALSKLGFPQ